MMERKYRVKIKLERIDGGIPEHPDVIEDWLKAAGIKDDEELLKRIAEGVATKEELDERLEKLTCTFIHDDGVPCIEARCVKAMIKQAAGVMGLYGMLTGAKELLAEGTEVYPKLVYLRSEHGLEVEAKPIHVSVKGEPVSAFKRTRFLRDATADFDVHVTDRQQIMTAFNADTMRKSLRTLTLDQLRMILEYGGKFVGLGSNRSQGSGKFVVLSIEEIDPPRPRKPTKKKK
jgi:hypothetical protein